MNSKAYPRRKQYPGLLVEFITMFIILIVLFYIVLPYLGGSAYPDMGDLFNLISKIIGSVKL